MRYRAFFSYSRDDDRVADWLHARLDGYRVPPLFIGQSGAHGAIPAKLHPIFRDRTDMLVGDVLDDRITAALAESESLIVLCSRSAASSPWVAQECATFIASGQGVVDISQQKVKRNPYRFEIRRDAPKSSSIWYLVRSANDESLRFASVH